MQAARAGPQSGRLAAVAAGNRSDSGRRVQPAATPVAIDLQIVEVYPYIEYIKYLLSGSIAMSIFIVAMIGGGITFIDDKSRGLHEGYLVTPITKAELILGLIFSGAIKGLMAGTTITIIGGLDRRDRPLVGPGAPALSGDRAGDRRRWP